VTFALAACIIAGVSGYPGHYDDHGPAYYNFDYGVHDAHTGDIKQQHEVRDGHVVKGSYSLAESDGTRRIVEYVAGPHNGFNAVVKRVGQAQHPQNYHHGSESLGGGLGGHYGGAESHVGPTHWGYNH
ncbi:hypothetical protein ILUMI_13323, partial [Ignelater luminosus]